MNCIRCLEAPIGWALNHRASPAPAPAEPVLNAERPHDRPRERRSFGVIGYVQGQLRGHVPNILALETEVGRLVPGPSRRWTSDGYSQGMLLELLERFGFSLRMLTALPASSAASAPICGFSFEDGKRHFAAYHADDGTALVMAAVLALRSIQVSSASECSGGNRQSES